MTEPNQAPEEARTSEAQQPQPTEDDRAHGFDGLGFGAIGE